RRDQRVVFETADCRELVMRDTRPERRRDVRQLSRVVRQYAESGEDRIADCRRHAQLLDIPSRPGIPDLTQLPLLDERLDRLVDEKRIAARPPMKALGELARPRCVSAERALEQLDDRVDRERRETEALSIS